MALVSCRCPSSSLVIALVSACAEEDKYLKRSDASQLVSVEEESFDNPETGTSLCIADGESLWCSVVLSGFSVGLGVTGPGFGQHNR